MRSRNGNRSFLFACLALILPLVWGNDQYYIGYRLTTQNNLPYRESFSLSRAMSPCGKPTGSSLSLKRLNDESLDETLKREELTFIEYATGFPVHLKSNDTLRTDSIKAVETLTVPTRCYAVEFNPDFVTISLIK